VNIKDNLESFVDVADLPDIKTFGKKRSHYYGADVGDYEIG